MAIGAATAVVPEHRRERDGHRAAGHPDPQPDEDPLGRDHVVAAVHADAEARHEQVHVDVDVVLQQLRDAEAEKMRNQKDAYSQQSILLSDLLKQQSSLADAESQYRQAVLVYWSTRADFQRTLGEE